MISRIKRKVLPKNEVKELEKAVNKYMKEVSKQIQLIERIERKSLQWQTKY